ncbi:hypothetical protein K474DRAFT_230467 [Panus rudis PR-1116 ss-1]|nr:hypothetical protein K474DRAFT_230467 [Panus rudis PR-1116 ss-1]
MAIELMTTTADDTLALLQKQHFTRSIQYRQPCIHKPMSSRPTGTHGKCQDAPSASPSFPVHQRIQFTRNKLIFDTASGVYILLDDGDWLVAEGDESNSDEDYGAMRRTNLNQSDTWSQDTASLGCQEGIQCITIIRNGGGNTLECRSLFCCFLVYTHDLVNTNN